MATARTDRARSRVAPLVRSGWGGAAAWGPALFVAGLWAAGVATHTVVRGFDPVVAAVQLFLAVNLLVCGWELVLLRYPDQVRADFDRHREQLADYRTLRDMFAARTGNAGLRPRYWYRVWSYYARLDRSYLDQNSYGYVIDVCNGLFTLLPSVFILAMMTWQAVPARALGMVMLATFYQMLYGTLAYFFAYLRNQRGRGHPLGRVLMLVGASNSVWIVFPAIGIGLAAQLIASGAY